MPVLPAYRDFFEFLARLGKGESAWELYQQCYLHRYRDFLLCYWDNFTSMNLGQIRERVERIRASDYSNLENLLRREDPEDIVSEALQRCGNAAPAPDEPTVYLMVGFFSSEGFVVRCHGKPVIGIGLERFEDFRSLGLVLAHEYCHYLRAFPARDAQPAGERTLGGMLLSEGLASLFSEHLYPERPLYDHLLISRETLNWCIKNENHLRSVAKRRFGSARLVSAFFRTGSEELKVPPRVGNYLGYCLLKEFREKMGASLSELLNLNHLPHGDLSDIC